MVSMFAAVQTIIARLVPASPTLATRLRIRSELGATAVEYGLTLLGIAAVVIAAVVLLGSKTNGNFQCTIDSIKAGTSRC